MRRILGLLFVFVCAAGALQPALAQKNAPAITRDSDRDGVMDPRDRCRGTAAGTRVDATGCPATAAPAPAAAAPAAAAPATSPAAAPLTNQATQPRPDTTHRAAGAALGAAAPAGAAAPPEAAPPGAQPTAAQPPNNTTRSTPPAGSAPAPGTSAPATSAPAAGAPNPGIAGAAGAAVASAATPNQPAATPARPVATPPAAAPALMAVTDPTETAGFWLPAYNGRTDSAQRAYAKLLVVKLDSAVIALVETFRNVSGNPVAGASDPGRLTSREKARWLRCRNIANDLHTIADAASVLKDSVAGGPPLQRSMVALAEAFEAMQALEGCDVITSMVESPDRFNPWQQNYENEARNFYRDWYGQVRTVHTAAREFARVLNGVLPADRRFPVPAAIPTTPPYIGAVR